MNSFAVQGAKPNDLPISYATGGSSSIGGSSQASGTTSFSRALERASAQQNCADRQNDDLRAVGENSVQRRDDQATTAAPAREDRRADGIQKKEQIDKNSAGSTQSASQTADAASNAAVQQVDAPQTTRPDEPPTNDVTITISLTDAGDGVKVSLQGLPAELLNALLAACSNGSNAGQAVAQAITAGTANQADSSASDDNGLASLTDGSVKQASATEGTAKLTVKIPLDLADVQNSVNQILSMLQALVGALEKNASNTVDLQHGQLQNADSKASDSLAQLLPNKVPINGASTNKGPTSTTAFTNLISESDTQDLEAATTATPGSIGLNVLPDSLSELKLPKDTDLTESLLSKVKVVVSLPGIVEATNETVEKETGASSGGNGNSNFAEQGASVQASIQHEETLAEASTTASFGSIVADRLAAVAEQVGVRERPLDILLRLKTEGGESLMVGLKDQAGKIVVQVRSADQNMVGFLESQKETIVRNLEAKQVSSSISVSPIEEDATKRQGREQQKNMWGRRREPANPYIETSI